MAEWDGEWGGAGGGGWGGLMLHDHRHHCMKKGNCISNFMLHLFVVAGEEAGGKHIRKTASKQNLGTKR